MGPSLQQDQKYLVGHELFELLNYLTVNLFEISFKHIFIFLHNLMHNCISIFGDFQSDNLILCTLLA